MRHLLLLLSVISVLSALLTFFEAPPCLAFSLSNPEYTGAGITVGTTYDPDPTFEFGQISFSAWYDYEQIMGHRAPDSLRFKFELNLGAADISEKRLLASFNFYALYYLEGIAVGRFRPYVEGGAGVVYSDFQCEGQGLRWNFNPQAGIGLQWYDQGGMDWYTSLHAYHISNGGLDSDNKGINGVSFQLGCLF